MKKIMMNVAGREKRVAILENNRVVELNIQQPHQIDIVGNIYSGRVVDVLPGMQAAFVDIGIGKNGFIHRDQLLAYQQSTLAVEVKKTKSISSFVRQGEEILVQVLKEGTDRKGPKLTGIIEIPGSFLVYQPHGDYIAVSRKMKTEEEREKWRDFGETNRKELEGIIFRTSCENHEFEEVLTELKSSRKKYEAIIEKQRLVKPPSVLFEVNHIVERIFDDVLKEEIEEIIIDDSEIYRDLKERVGSGKVTYYSKKENLFSEYQIEREIEKALKTVVWLDNGAYLLIEQTEALTVIDVNTGKFSGKENLRDTVLRTNIAAASEIAHQFRVRDVSGIILIDFIDMKDESDRLKVIKALKSASSNDPNRIRIIGFTGLGILELTRKKVRQDIQSVLQTDCPICKGSGKVDTAETVAFKLERALWELRGMEHDAVWVEATEDVITVFSGDDGQHVSRLEDALFFKIYVTELNSAIPAYVVRQVGARGEIEERIGK